MQIEENENENQHACYKINTYMLPAKLSYLTNQARYAITDYLLLFYTSTGLSPSHAGMINGLQYVGGMVGNPLWGYVADRKGYRRLIIAFLSLMGIIAYCLQPILASSYANHTNNVCPVMNQTANYTKENAYVDNTKNYEKLYYSLIVVALFAASFDGSIMSFIDAGVLRRIKRSPKPCDVGKQRYAGSVGYSLGSIAYSFSIKYFPHGPASCFVGLFVTYSIFAILTIITSFKLFKGLFKEENEERQEKEENVNTILVEHLKKFDTIFFLVTVLFNGTIQAFKFSFLFLFLKELHAPTLLFGFSISLNSVSAITVYLLSSEIIKVLGGAKNAMTFSTFAWSLRFLCTAYLVNPFYILAIDIFHGFTYSLFRVASLEFVKETTDARIFTSMCGVLNSIYLCLSFLVANVVGGKLYQAFGARKMFLGASIVCFVWTVSNILWVLLNNVRSHFKPLRDDPIHSDPLRITFDPLQPTLTPSDPLLIHSDSSQPTLTNFDRPSLTHSESL